METFILVVNCGSSSLKLALFDHHYRLRASALAERLNNNDAFARISGDENRIALPDNTTHGDTLRTLVSVFRERGLMTSDPVAVGHRVVHGGEAFYEAALIDETTLGSIQDCASLAPLHNPVNLSGIEAGRSLFPGVPQVAVFDTAYHQTLPEKAFLYAVPDAWYRDWGVRRYGFHGTSHGFMATEAARILNRSVDSTSVISAHLGNGCSITAIRNGLSVDTSMGFTPLEGLIMGTRSGDIDPGLFDFLVAKGLSIKDINKTLNHQSGLLGISGHTNDMRSLCAHAEAGHKPSLLAIDMFCFRLARYIGAMMASLTRLDALVFTGGIGENSAQVRHQTLEHLHLMGFDLDPALNDNNGRSSEGHIESGASRFPVLVIPTNEELVIAREAANFATTGTFD